MTPLKQITYTAANKSFVQLRLTEKNKILKHT